MKTWRDPVVAFHSDDSPVGLHVRANWLGDSSARAKAARAAHDLRRAQEGDGSWRASVATTLQKLFDLWLLSPSADQSAHRALDWLLEVGHEPRPYACYPGLFFHRMGRGDRAALRDMKGVPFTGGCCGFVKTGAVLFLATLFDKSHAHVVEGYRTVEAHAKRSNGRLCSGSCANNLKLALAAHPRHRKGEGMKHIISHLAAHQTPAGSWGGGIPFYPTFYLLSFLDDRAARRQFDSALGRLRRTQNADGTWGRSNRHVATWMVLDSLKRRGLHPSAGD